MKHATAAGPRLLAALLGFAPALSPALGLGDLAVQSALGEPLEATLAITALPEESVSAECFFVTRPPAAGLPPVMRVTFTVESRTRVRLRSASSVTEPAAVLRVNASCPAGGGLVTREYPVLLDPRPVARVVPSRAPVAPASSVEVPPPAPAGPPGTPTAPGMRSMAGDTPAGLAAAIYPRNRRAREAFVAALREANPAVAGLAPDDPIPPGTPLALPDLRSVSRGIPASRESAPAAEPRKPKPARAAPAPRAEPREKPVRVPRATAPAAKAKRDPAFTLRLSSSEVDLARSKGIDDRARAQLRERLLVLDADDQVAALLQLRNSLRQLEGRVAELQLRLSGPLASVPARPEGTKPGAVPAPTAPPADPATPASTPATVPGASAIASPPAPDAAEAKPAPPSAPASESTPAGTPAPAPKAAAEPKAPKAPAKAPVAEPLPDWLWGVFAALVLAIGAIVLRLVSRRRAAASAREAALARSRAAQSFAAAQADDLDEAPSPGIRPPDHRFDDEAPEAGRAVAESDAMLTTRLDAAEAPDLRRRYLEERFPEIANGTISLKDDDSVVKGARLFYEDGALPRAVELLQFAIEERPAAQKPWLALFEILRLENLGGEFAALAARFKDHHGATENWRKVQFIGRELDPANPLFRDEAFSSLETIGYPQAAKTAEIAFDPLAENWLNAPMDFTSDALAAELRRGVLADAGVAEADLIPDPMPALKNVEMFTVA